MSYTLEKAEEMARALRTLPAMDESKRRLSKQAVVKHLVAEIAALQQRGYTIEQVVESLQGVGFDDHHAHVEELPAASEGEAGQERSSGSTPAARRRRPVGAHRGSRSRPA